VPSAVATVGTDGTPLYRGAPIRDCRQVILDALRKHPRRTFEIGAFGITLEQAIWACEMLLDAGEIVRVSNNSYRLAVKASEKIPVAKSTPALVSTAPANGKPQRPPAVGLTNNICAILREFGEPMSTVQIAEMLDIEVPLHNVRVALSQLKSKGALTTTKMPNSTNGRTALWRIADIPDNIPGTSLLRAPEPMPETPAPAPPVAVFANPKSDARAALMARYAEIQKQLAGFEALQNEKEAILKLLRFWEEE